MLTRLKINMICMMYRIHMSFVSESRMVPSDLLDDPDEPFSLVRDELPFMDTDIARGVAPRHGFKT